MMQQRMSLGALALAIAMLAVGCGQAADQDGTLHVTSVPKAEVFVDGVSQGTTGEAIALSAGEHKIQVKLDRFIAHEETVTVAAGATLDREVTLAAKDPSDPVVIAKLAECEGVDVAPFVAPETHRGSRGKRAIAVLLWPAKDIRKAGLVNYAVEADETYEGDATLEFRHGRKVLYREAFNPESVTTIRPIPAEVLEHIKVGTKLTWGLYFEDSRRPVKTSFKVVQRPKAERQLDRLAKSRHMLRQPKITQEIMAATVLENNRLYTEALVSNLKIAADHPHSTQPSRGIITTLRRLDAEDSELFAFVSPHVSGKGGRSGFARPTATAGGADLGIGAWSPIQKGAVPTVIADATPSSGKGMGPGGRGVTPQGGTAERPADPSTSGEAAPSAGTGADAREHALQQMRDTISELDGEYKVAQDEYARADADAQSATKAAADADAKAKAAEAAAAAARSAVENAASPTREQQEDMYRAGMAAEEAREAANAARQAAEEAGQKARDLEGRNAEMKQNLDTMNKALEGAMGNGEVPPGTEAPKAPTADEAKQAFDSAQAAATDARTSWDVAKKGAAAAEAAYAADPSETNRNMLENAQLSLEAAAKHAHQMDQALEAAKSALETIGNQVQEAGRK
ncbi:MAG: PEGA domain-containing protein [Planctomycetota bacterium]|nr:PEGA domain-containing protein [Planctomycetota bacterium]